jgi:hypothetical protein
MEELLRWLHEEAPLYHPLIAGTLFFHEFESIHPFEDGNGRVGRVLFHGYLQNNGLENAHKCMIEPALTADKDLYYRILAHTDHTGSYTELVDFFVSRTLASYRDAVDRFRSLDLLTSRVDENKKRLLIQARRVVRGGGSDPLGRRTIRRIGPHLPAVLGVRRRAGEHRDHEGPSVPVQGPPQGDHGGGADGHPCIPARGTGRGQRGRRGRVKGTSASDYSYRCRSAASSYSAPPLGNQSPISNAAVSAESEPWMMLRPICCP